MKYPTKQDEATMTEMAANIEKKMPPGAKVRGLIRLAHPDEPHTWNFFFVIKIRGKDGKLYKAATRMSRNDPEPLRSWEEKVTEALAFLVFCNQANFKLTAKQAETMEVLFSAPKKLRERAKGVGKEIAAIPAGEGGK